jgi:uncharacterized protein with GYD domain
MATYIIMGKFTTQGIKNVKETTKRADRFKEIAAGFGVKVKDTYWLTGEYDVANIVEAEDEFSISALMLELGAWGNVATTTFRAYTREDMDAIISRMNGIK